MAGGVEVVRGRLAAALSQRKEAEIDIGDVAMVRVLTRLGEACPRPIVFSELVEADAPKEGGGPASAG